LNLSKWTKNEKDMGFEIRKGPKKKFKNFETKYHLSSSSSSCAFSFTPLLPMFKEHL
jgi:hypothetical protein